MQNAAHDRRNAQELDFLRALLDRWIDETGDTVPRNPTADRQDAKGNKIDDHTRGTMPGAEKKATTINRRGPVLVQQERDLGADENDGR